MGNSKDIFEYKKETGDDELCLIVGGQIANFGEKPSSSFNYFKRMT